MADPLLGVPFQSAVTLQHRGCVPYELDRFEAVTESPLLWIIQSNANPSKNVRRLCRGLGWDLRHMGSTG
jgi:hypothetical protein